MDLLFEFLHTNRARAIIAETALALFLFFADPLGVEAHKARVIDDAWDVFTQFWRPSGSTKNLAVVLIDQDTLDAWHIDWPLSYGQVLGLIHGLACAKATGVFFDFTLSRKYPDPGEEKQLRDAIEKADSPNRAPDWPGCGDENPPLAIKVFFGKAEHIDTPLAERMDRGDHAFAIDVEAEDSVYPAGKDEFPDAPLPTSQVSPAFGVVRTVPDLWETDQASAAKTAKPNGGAVKVGDICSDPDTRPECWFEPLVLQWSAAIDPNQSDVGNTQTCRGDPGLVTLLAGMLGITKQERYQPCPPILTLKAEDLFRDRNYIDANGNPAKLLKKRFVFIGTRLAGLNDQIYSPVHGYLPGVYKHAVATAILTDTAMKDQTNYPTVPRPWRLGGLVVVTYILLEAVKEFSGGLPRRKLIILAALAAAFLVWVAIICLWKWPVSLVLTVLGYYFSAVLFVRASGSWSSTKLATPEEREP